MYFSCICREEGDLHILLLCHLEGPLSFVFDFAYVIFSMQSFKNILNIKSKLFYFSSIVSGFLVIFSKPFPIPISSSSTCIILYFTFICVILLDFIFVCDIKNISNFILFQMAI